MSIRRSARAFLRCVHALCSAAVLASLLPAPAAAASTVTLPSNPNRQQTTTYAPFHGGADLARTAPLKDTEAQILHSAAVAQAAGPPAISATKRDRLQIDNDGDTRADLGDRLRYTIVVSNTGTGDATGIAFNDTIDPNTTLSSAVRTSPLALTDAYTAIGNVPIAPAGASNLLANDRDPDGSGALMVLTTNTTSANGGIVVISPNGDFTYTPAPGYEGTDTFSYTVRDIDNNIDTATVTITVSGMIWFVNNTAAAGGNGTLARPFNCLVGAGCLSTAPHQAGDTIFVSSGSGNYSAGLTLLNDQRLIGQGATASLESITGLTPAAYSAPLPATGGANPTLVTTAANTNAITVGSGNTIRGLTIGNTTDTDISGSSIGTLTINEVVLNGTGRALNLANGTLSATIQSITVNAQGPGGVLLNGVGGTLTVGATQITNPTGTGIDIQNSSAAISFGITNVNKDATTGSGVNLAGNSGDITFNSLNIITNNGNGLVGSNNSGAITVTSGSGSINAINGAAISLGNTTGNPSINLKFTTLNTTNSPANAVNLTRVGGTGLTVSGASTFDMAPGSNNGVNLSNVATTGISFGTIAVNDRYGTGILLNTVSGTATFGVTTIPNPNSVGGYGIRILNSSAAVSFPSVTISSPKMVTAQVDGDTNGLPDNDGDGDGISLLNNTGSFTLNGGSITSPGNDGIDARNVQNVTLSGLTVLNPGLDVGGAGEGGGGHGVYFLNLGGTNNIQGSTISQFNRPNGNGMRVINTNVNLTGLNIDSTTFSNAATGNDGLLVEARGSSNMTVVVQNNSRFTGLFGNGVQAGTVTNASGTVNISILNSVFENAAASGDNGISIVPFGGPATMNATIQGNRLEDVKRPGVGNGVVTMTSGGAAGSSPILNAIVSGNTIRNSTGARGIFIVADTYAGPLNATITNNDIDRLTKFGIIVSARGNAAAANVTITNNRIGQLVGFVGQVAVGTTDQGISTDTQGTAVMRSLIKDNIVTINNNSTSTSNTSEVIRIRAIGTSTHNATLQNNTLINLNGIHKELGVTANNGLANICFNATGNTLPGGGVGVIDLDGSAGTIRVTQASSAALSMANSGATVTPLGNVQFGQSVCSLPALMASEGEGFGTDSGSPLQSAELQRIADEAKQRWIASGLTAEEIAILQRVSVVVAEMPIGQLGAADDQANAVLIDPTAAGWGWFIDPTPDNDDEFVRVSVNELRVFEGNAASERMDLLTVVMHEIGHLLGHAHSHEGLMADSLRTGARQLLPAHDDNYRIAELGSSSAAANEQTAQSMQQTLLSTEAVIGTSSPVTMNRFNGRMAALLAAQPADPIELTIGTLPPGKAITITFDVVVNNPVSPGASQVSNQATISGSNFTSVVTNDPDTSAANDPTITPLDIKADLALSKSDGGLSAVAGMPISYTLTYTNTGPNVAGDVVITETVPLHTSFNAADSSAGWNCVPNNNAGSSCTLAVGALGIGEVSDATFVLTMTNRLPAGVELITNTATIGSSLPDPQAGNNTANDTTAVEAAPDLVITKSDGGVSVQPGETLVYTLRYTNTGTQGATGVVLTETVPANSSFKAADSSAGWNCTPDNNAGSICTLSVGNLPAGNSGSKTFAVTTIGNVGVGIDTIDNNASIADDGSNGADLTPGDNTTSDTAPINAQPDLVLSKSDGGASAVHGGTVVYTLNYTNSGTRTAAGVVLTETVPFHSSFNAGASTAGWSCADGSPGGSVCTLNIGTLVGGGASGTASFAVTVPATIPDGAEQLLNTASIGDNGAGGIDTNLNDNSASETTLIDESPEMRAFKTDNNATIRPGETITYTTTARNFGYQDAVNVVITETVPLHTVFSPADSSSGWSCADGAPAGTTCTITIPSVQARQDASRTFAVRVVNPVAAGVSQISNTVTVSNGTGDADPLPSNNSASDTTPLIAAPDLVLNKVDGGISAGPQDVITYTLTITNAGDQNATGVVITETVPPHTTFNAATSSAGWSCADGAAAGTSCQLTVGNLAGAGGSATRSFAVTVIDPLPLGAFSTTNTAQASDNNSNGVDPTPANNSASVTTALVAQPDLEVSKSDNGMIALPGDTISYTLLYTNTGKRAATGVVLTETVPLNTVFNPGVSTAGWTCTPTMSAGSTCTLTVGSVHGRGGNGSAIFAVAVVNPLPAGVTQVSNTVRIGDDGVAGVDLDPSNNSATDTTLIDALSDLTLGKSDGGVTAVPGGVITYTLRYTNTGNQNATGVIITESVPADTIFNAGASAAGWSCADGSAAGTSCTLTVGSLAGGASGEVTFAVTVITPVAAGVEQISNTASIAEDGSNGADPTPANNSASDTTLVDAAPNLSLSKSDNGAIIAPGGTLTYTLSYTNIGNQNATGVNITETVPLNTVFNAGTSTAGWSCADGSPAGTVCILKVGDLAGGASGTATFAVTVVTPVPAGVTEITNTANVADDGSNGADSTPANNSASNTTPVNTTIDLAITKRVSSFDLLPGQPITYTLGFTATGDTFAANVRITDTLSSSLTGVSISSSGVVITDTGTVPTYVWTVEDMAPGASGIITITGIIDPKLAADAAIVNTAEIAGTGDVTLGNNSASVSVDVIVPQVSFSEPAYGIGEGAGTALITATLNPVNPFLDASVEYATSDGTATASNDYTSRSGTLDFPAGTTVVTFTVPIIDDQEAESVETVRLSLSNPNGAQLGDAAAATLTINDNDSPGITVQPLSLNVSEGGASASYSVVLNSQPTSDVTISITTDGQTTVNPTTLTFTSANWDSPQQVLVAAVDDVVAEATHTGSISHAAASTDMRYNGISVSQVIATITDNDNAGVIVQPTRVAVAEGGATASYELTLTSEPTSNVTISITTDGQTTVNPTTLTFTPANWDSPQQVVVAAVDDTAVEGDHTSTISHSATSGDGEYQGVNIADVQVTITDNDSDSNQPAVYIIGLPMMSKAGEPDLVVTSITVSPNKTSFASGEPVEIKVVVKNGGTAATGPFWVDLSINPDLPPTRANQIWNEHCSLTPCYGLSWYVEDGLAPGASMVLTSKDLPEGYSIWTGGFAAGSTDLYAYVDSYNPGQAAGLVIESDETNNQFHLGGISVTGANPPEISSEATPLLSPRPVRLIP